MSQAAFSLSDRKELQGVLQNEISLSRREQELVAYSRQKNELVIVKLLSCRDFRSLSGRLSDSC